VFAASPSSVDVFVIDTTGGLEATVLTDEFRSAGLRADRAYDNRSMKSQMKAADRSNARVAVIIGTDEQASQQAVVRPMNGGEQFTVSRSSLLDSVLRVVRTSEPSTTPKESQ
jgi:histidyl-tRNA synthetase